MKLKRKKLISVLLSILYPGAGHLFGARFIIGAVGVVLTTWALIALLIAVLVFKPGEGLGAYVFPLSLYTLGGLWVFMLSSILFKDVQIRRIRMDRDEVYTKAYTAYLRKEYPESLQGFTQLFRHKPDDIAAGLMTAAAHCKLDGGRKARGILKGLRKLTDDPLWQWEINSALESLDQEPASI